MILKEFKNKKGRIRCYITEEKNGFSVCTGKPSDSSCLCWHYKTLSEAEETAKEYFENYEKGF